MRTRKDLLIFEGGEGGQFQHETNFFEDDLETLVEWGFQRKDYSSRGDEMFIMTRRAEKFVNAAAGGSRGRA